MFTQQGQAKLIYNPSYGGPDNWEFGMEVKKSRLKTLTKRKGTIIYFTGNAGAPDQKLKAVNLFGNYQEYVFRYPGYGQGYQKEEVSKDLIINKAMSATESLINNGPIILCGISLGTSVACEVASKLSSKYPDTIKGLILITPFTKLTKVVDGMVPMLGTLFLYDRFDCINNLRNYKGKVIIVASEQDEITPYSMAKEIADKYDYPLVKFTGSHNSVHNETQKKEWVKEVRGFVKKTM